MGHVKVIMDAETPELLLVAVAQVSGSRVYDEAAMDSSNRVLREIRRRGWVRTLHAQTRTRIDGPQRHRNRKSIRGYVPLSELEPLIVEVTPYGWEIVSRLAPKLAILLTLGKAG